MSPQELTDAYLQALRDADVPAMLSLFTPDAVVHSPLCGPTPAADFYPALFADTSQTRVTARGLTTGSTTEGRDLVSVWFHFLWFLPSARPAPFDVVDVMELVDDRIAALHIVYDTVDVHPAYEQDTGRASWRTNRPGCSPSRRGPPAERRSPVDGTVDAARAAGGPSATRGPTAADPARLCAAPPGRWLSSYEVLT